ncbi:MAG: hypothetical protein JNL04_15675 [Rhodospirillaceae bacterium]|nr:hypothetical protein [Rhodospirillaceae bacterium]
MTLVAPVSWGELIDKITILEIKLAKLGPGPQLDNVRREFDALAAVRDRNAPSPEAWREIAGELKAINEALWKIEDDIRECEREKRFDAEFIELARSVYRTNDKRAAAKRRLNDRMGSVLVEEKLYRSYD